MRSLEKITVLDFSRLLPGPFCGMLLRGLGCRVIRVELPHFADDLRDKEPMIDGHGFLFWWVNRGKESLCLDFRKPGGLKALDRMLAKADVLVEGFRPGLMDRIGLGWDALKKRFPRLVYCSLTGYGQAGPRSELAGHDINFLARSGFLGAGDSNGGVSFPATQIGDLAGSFYAVQGVLAALLDRTATGTGRRVDVSMADAAASWMVLPRAWVRATGKDFEPGSHWLSGTHPFYRLYKTRDGRRLSVGALERPFASALLKALRRPDLEDLARKDDPESRKRLGRVLARIFAKRSLADWDRTLAGVDACVAPVKTTREAMAEGRPPVIFSGDSPPIDGTAPRLGADNARVLRSFGFGPEEIVRLEEAGLAICGSRRRGRLRSTRRPSPKAGARVRGKTPRRRAGSRRRA